MDWPSPAQLSGMAEMVSGEMRFDLPPWRGSTYTAATVTFASTVTAVYAIDAPSGENRGAYFTTPSVVRRTSRFSASAGLRLAQPENTGARATRIPIMSGPACTSGPAGVTPARLPIRRPGTRPYTSRIFIGQPPPGTSRRSGHSRAQSVYPRGPVQQLSYRADMTKPTLWRNGLCALPAIMSASERHA